MQEYLFEFQIVNKVPPLALQLVKPKADIAKAALVGRRGEHFMDGVSHGIENAGVSIAEEDQFHWLPSCVTIIRA